MIVRFDKSFYRALGKIKDRTVLKRIEGVILKAESTSSIDQLTNTKKLTGIYSLLQS